MLSPKEVVNKWVDAFNDGDVDMIIIIFVFFHLNSLRLKSYLSPLQFFHFFIKLLGHIVAFKK